jgi:hypothetical protein
VKLNLRLPWSAVVAISVGVVVLLGYFLAPAQPGETSLFLVLRDYFLQIGVILAAVAMLVGLLNLAKVHAQKVRQRSGSRLGSLIVLAAMLVTFGLASVDFFLGNTGDPAQSLAQYVFRYIQVPVERSLMALLAIALALAAIRMLSRRPNLITGVFLVVFFIVLVGTGLELPYLSDTIQPWISNVWALAGTRGLLLGIGLGTLATGLRILTGSDRPYGG